jgi:hypothetical protein
MIPFIKIIPVPADQLVLNQYKLPFLITAASCMPKLQILAFGQKYASIQKSRSRLTGGW